MNIQKKPITVEVRRGSMVESEHQVSFALVDNKGKVLAGAGDVEREIYPRSAIKPLQAIALVESGAAQAHGLSASERSLSCASHNGEARQVAAVETWLKRIGMTAEDLECGCQRPSYETDADALVKAGTRAGPQHNNCSGKHCGFLTLAKHMSYPTAGYIKRDHPLQQHIMGVLEVVFGVDLTDKRWGHDGCGIPTIAVPIGNIAMGMARFAQAGELAEQRQQACATIARSIGEAPYFIAGTGRLCTDIISAAKGRVIAKTGAEGVYAASFLDSGLGLCLKAHDGAKRASDAAMLGLLEQLNILEAGQIATIKVQHSPIIANWAGTQTGDMRVRF